MLLLALMQESQTKSSLNHDSQEISAPQTMIASRHLLAITPFAFLSLLQARIAMDRWLDPVQLELSAAAINAFQLSLLDPHVQQAQTLLVDSWLFADSQIQAHQLQLAIFFTQLQTEFEFLLQVSIPISVSATILRTLEEIPSACQLLCLSITPVLEFLWLKTALSWCTRIALTSLRPWWWTQLLRADILQINLLTATSERETLFTRQWCLNSLKL